MGCIFFEMAAGRPLFPGSTVADELHMIFKALGKLVETSYCTFSSHDCVEVEEPALLFVRFLLCREMDCHNNHGYPVLRGFHSLFDTVCAFRPRD